MTKRIRRSNSVEVNLLINNDDFIKPPRAAQRNALLTRALKEFTDDLDALDILAQDFVTGKMGFSLSDRTQSKLSDDEIMEDWQIPIMQEMANMCAESKGDILEIGFGRGISSDMLQEKNIKSHTIIECNDSVVERFKDWKKKYANRKIELVHGLWQDTINRLGWYDGIFFHTYPLNEEEYLKYVNSSVTFAEHFFPVAAEHLNEGGVFTYFSNEMDSLSRAHQRSLLRHFSSFSVKIVSLDLPENVQDTWWANSIVVVKAIK